MRCFNSDCSEYQKLLQIAEASGYSEFKLRAYVSDYYDKFGRFPHLDLIPGINSAEFLIKQLGIEKKDSSMYVTTQRLKEFTGKDTLQEQIAYLNNTYTDKEIYITGQYSNGECIIKIQDRPSMYTPIVERNIDWNTLLREQRVVKSDTGEITKSSSVSILNNIIQRLAERRGINIKQITNDEIAADPNINQYVKNANQVSGFIYNGTIYINTDIASADAPLHELMHLIIGQLRVRNKVLYEKLLMSVENLKDFNTYYNNFINKDDVYHNRTQLDIYEEILVNEFAKFITDPTYKDGLFYNTDEETRNAIFQDVMYAIDTALLPEQSAATLPKEEVMNASILNLSQKLGSTLILSQYLGTLDLNDAIESRRLANTKQDFINKGYLKQDCNPQ